MAPGIDYQISLHSFIFFIMLFVMRNIHRKVVCHAELHQPYAISTRQLALFVAHPTPRFVGLNGSLLFLFFIVALFHLDVLFALLFLFLRFFLLL